MTRPRVLVRLLQIQRALVRHGLDDFVRATHLYRPFRFLVYLSPWTWFQRSIGVTLLFRQQVQIPRRWIVEIDRSSWQHISAALWNWIYPEYAAKNTQVPEEKKRVMRDFATQMLRELCPLADGRPGVAAGPARRSGGWY